MKKTDGRYESLRKRAEAALQASGDTGADFAAVDMRALIHDLGVHQIELEMQNDELMAAQSALQQARDEYQGLYNNAPVGFLTLDGQGVILRHNQTFAEMLGSPGLTFIGVSLAVLMAADERDLFLARYKAFHRVPEGKNIDVRFLRSGVADFWARITGRLERWESGRDISDRRLLVSVLDISAEALAMRELRQARDEADAANRAKSQFLSNVSHEIRTPMNGILGMAQLLEMTSLGPEQKTFVELINVSGRNLVTLINSVLDLSKIESGLLELDHSPFSLRRCVRETVASLATLARLRGLEVFLEFDPDLPGQVVGDEPRLTQIVTNLVSNAVKFTDRGHVRITVALARRDAAGCVVAISVADTGIGIDPLQHRRIFEPFIQAAGPHPVRPGGTGLGLSICRKLADLMGGSIEMESEAGKGSVFHVRLPLALSAGVGPDCAPGVPAGDASEPLRVLVAEDNEANRFYLQAALRRMGHSVLLAEDGRQALEAWRSEPVDCILMDIMMPNLSGDEVAAVIRSREAASGRRTPVIALTAMALAEEKAAYAEAGFDAYLTKPVLYETLREELARVVASVRACGG